MKNLITINSKINPLDTDELFFNTFSPEKIEYLFSDSMLTKEGEDVFFIAVKLKNDVSLPIFAESLGAWIISNYTLQIIKEILNQRFMEFDDTDTAEIIENTQNSVNFFNMIYGNKLIVKKLSNYFETYDYISVEGFLRFRVAEYRRAVEMLLSEAIEELYIKKEYSEFICLIKQYVDECPCMIDFVHVKVNLDGDFAFYDFKKTEVLLEKDNRDLTEIFSTREDLLVSVLISLAPKRIMWHSDFKNSNQNVFNTVKEIFGDRVSVCSGCELCNDKSENV